MLKVRQMPNQPTLEAVPGRIDAFHGVISETSVYLRARERQPVGRILELECGSSHRLAPRDSRLCQYLVH
jgi:hypothetical protein